VSGRRHRTNKRKRGERGSSAVYTTPVDYEGAADGPPLAGRARSGTGSPVRIAKHNAEFFSLSGRACSLEFAITWPLGHGILVTRTPHSG